MSGDEPDLVLEQLLTSRRSCRGFLPQQVPQATIERMLTLAQASPSWCNTQPWQAIVTSSAATHRFREALIAHVGDAATKPVPDLPFPERYDGAAGDRRREVGWMLYDAVGVARGDRAGSARQGLRNFEFFGAPHVAIITTDRSLGVYGAVDTGLYVGTLLLAAQSLGIGAIAQAALATYSPFLRDHFAIPEDRQVLAGVSFGYPDPAHPANNFRAPRVPIWDVVTWFEG